MKRFIAALSFAFALAAAAVWLGFTPGDIYGRPWSLVLPDVARAMHTANGISSVDMAASDSGASSEFDDNTVAKNVSDGVLAMREGIQSPFRLPAGGDEDITGELLAQVERAIDKIRRELPEVFWISLGSYMIEWSGSRESGEGDLTVYIEYCYSPEQVEDIDSRLEAVIAEILKDAPQEPHDAVTYFHDWIIENTDYASDIVCEDGDSDSKQGKEYAFNIDGVFLRGSAVCEGYSKAFKLLCDRAGIPCENVFGVAAEQSHSWNHVLLGGRWYLVDVTWDDPVGGEGLLLHDYFLRGSHSEINGQTVEEIYQNDNAGYHSVSRLGYE